MKKKILLITIIFLIVITITGCRGIVKNKNTEVNVQEQSNNYVGTYNSEDGSYIKITKNGDKYIANISLYRLASFDNCTVDIVAKDLLAINGNDPNGNPVKFLFNLGTKRLIVTKSTWDLLPVSTKMNFDK